MAPLELVVGRRLRRETRLGAQRRQQVDRRPEPPRRQRVARPEVVGQRAGSVHEEHAWHDSRDGTGLHHAPPRQARDPARDAGRAHRHRGRRHPSAARRADVRHHRGLARTRHRRRAARRRFDRRSWPPSPTWPPGSARTARSGSSRARARPRRSATSRSWAAAKASGLVDNKVASFSPTHTSLRLVIPVALRGVPSANA